jgi:hypothetical protein
VNVDVNGLVIAFPATSFTPVLMVAVMLAELGNGLVGVNSAMRVAAV